MYAKHVNIRTCMHETSRDPCRTSSNCTVRSLWGTGDQVDVKLVNEAIEWSPTWESNIPDFNGMLSVVQIMVP